MAGKLIAFYSRADENYVSGQRKTLPVGNTEIAAGILQKLTGAELFRIEQLQPYAKDYDTCTAQAQADQRRNARPVLKALPENLEGYDVIYLGFPNYWGTMPMAVFTFLEAFDFAGKTICPFCTHEGSGMGSSERDIRRVCPGAEVRAGLAILGSRAGRAEKEIKNWIGGLDR